MSRPTYRMRLLAAIAMAVASAGCHHSYQSTSYNHCVDRYIARKRASLQAWYVWMQCRDQCGCERLCDFRRGFIDGYCNVALGGDGCAPVVPPSRYWGWRYQDCEGEECVAAWYQGFPAGVTAALQVGTHYEIQTIVPETAEYEEFQTEFYNSYDSTPSPAPLPSDLPAPMPQVTPAPMPGELEAPMVPPATEEPDAMPRLPEGEPVGEPPSPDLIAPEAPVSGTETTDIGGRNFSEGDLLDSLDALERETLQRASR